MEKDRPRTRSRSIHLVLHVSLAESPEQVGFSSYDIHLLRTHTRRKAVDQHRARDEQQRTFLAEYKSSIEIVQLPRSLPHVTAKLPRSPTQVRPLRCMKMQGCGHMASELSPTTLRQSGEFTVQMDPWRKRETAPDSTKTRS